MRPPNNSKNGHFHLELLDRLTERDLAHQRQQTREWRDAYRVRGGIEATNSELKRAHGLGRLRVRRMARVRLAVTCKLTACNIKRWIRALLAAARAARAARTRWWGDVAPIAALLAWWFAGVALTPTEPRGPGRAALA